MTQTTKLSIVVATVVAAAAGLVAWWMSRLSRAPEPVNPAVTTLRPRESTDDPLSCHETWNLETQAPATDDFLKQRSCWFSQLGPTPTTDPNAAVTLQLGVIGVNHPPTKVGCCGPECNDYWMDTPALQHLFDAMRSDWSGSSQILALTGVRPEAFPCDWTVGGSFDDQFAAGPGAHYNFVAHHPLPEDYHKWRTDQPELATLSLPRWQVVASSDTTIAPAAAGYATGLYRVVFQDGCNSNIKFSVFIIHLDVNSADARQAQMYAATDAIYSQVSNDEYAPIFIGDFNGFTIDGAGSDPDGTRQYSFTQLAYPHPTFCADGAFAGRNIVNDTTMMMYFGKLGNGSMFGFTQGHFVPIRQSANADGIDGAGVRVDGISHILVGVGLRAESNPNPCPDRQIQCRGTCVDLTSDASNCGHCGIDCGTGGTCIHGECYCPNKCCKYDCDPDACACAKSLCSAGKDCSVWNLCRTCGCKPSPRCEE